MAGFNMQRGGVGLRAAGLLVLGLLAIASGTLSCDGGSSPTPAPTPTPTPTPTPSTSLSGTVTDATSGAPIASATAAIQGKSATTGADGRYSISDLTNGQAELTVRHQGHRNSSQTITLAGATTFDVKMTTGLESRAAGNWTGSWRNTTFGSSGSMTMQVSTDTIAQTMAITFDLGGSVFGAAVPGGSVALADPPAKTIRGSYSTDEANLSLSDPEFFGDLLCAAFSFGKIECSSADVPGPRVRGLKLSGTLEEPRVDLVYEVIFEEGGNARGEVTLRKP